METNKIVILLVDDNNFHLDLIKLKLNNLGYSNVVARSFYHDAVEYLDLHTPDIVILDYYLDKSNTGLKLVNECLLNTDIPVIFMSSFYGEEVFKEILNVHPTSFIPKNASEFDLDKTIKLATAKKGVSNLNKKITDYIIVRYGRLFKKLAVADIEYVKVDGKYLNLYADNKIFLIRSTLSDFEKMLPDNFIKVHQAYAINLKFLDSINLEEGILKVGRANVPFSRNHKKAIFKAYYHP